MFIEESLPTAVRAAPSYGDRFAVEVAIDPRDGKEYTRIRHKSPQREYTVDYIMTGEQLWQGILDLYHRVYGTLAGFRVKFLDDFSSKNHTQPPTALDQSLVRLSAGVYQLQKQYGENGTPLSIGRPVRVIYKPVSGSVKIAVNGIVQPTGWTLDAATGRVTFAVDPGALAAVTGGFYFDIPCRFTERFLINHAAYRYRETGKIALIEQLNP